MTYLIKNNFNLMATRFCEMIFIHSTVGIIKQESPGLESGDSAPSGRARHFPFLVLHHLLSANAR